MLANSAQMLIQEIDNRLVAGSRDEQYRAAEAHPKRVNYYAAKVVDHLGGRLNLRKVF